MANEKRLIDADAMREDWLENGENEYVYDTNAVLASIDAQPTVDAVEVVRCKDCRWAREKDHREPTDTPDGTLICQCHMHHHIPAPWGARLAVKPDGFCDCGERK